MTQQSPVGDLPNASGETDDPKEAPSYESFQKLLGEKKKIQDQKKQLETELAEHREKIAQATREQEENERKRLESKEQFKDLYQKTQTELAKKEQALNELQAERVNAKKMTSFLDAIKADVPRQYWGLVDLDQITLEGDKVDEFSVQAYVESFKTTYSDILKPRETRRMPNDKPDPNDNGSALSYEEWLKLPAKEKEIKMHLVKK
jgi:hypothetical protein